MERLAFKMYLNEGQKEEYRKRHNELWPELRQFLKGAGVSEYSIFSMKKPTLCLPFRKLTVKTVHRILDKPKLFRNGGHLWQIS